MSSPLYVTKPHGTVVAVQVPIADWIELLERICDLEEHLRPTSKLDRQLDALVRQRLRKKKDQLGFPCTQTTAAPAPSST